MTEEEKMQALSGLLYLSACVIRGLRPERSRVEQMDLGNVYRVSCSHALTNLTYEAVQAAYDGVPPDTPLLKRWREARDKAVTKNLLLDAEREALLDWMERTGIWYLPLKGCILKDLYPKSGMRQMSDNDILFDTTYRAQVRDWFVARGYVGMYQHCVHDCYQKAPVYNFEMHTSLFSFSFRSERWTWAAYYKDVKQRLLPDEGKRYGYHFSDEDFYLYFTAHACKHYLDSGTGLRTLLDFHVYLSAKGDSLDWDYLRSELAKLQLVAFEQQTRELAQKVFADPENFSVAQLSEAEQQLLRAYLFSGTYGTTEQRVKSELEQLAGAEGSVTWRTKFHYVWIHLFPDRQYMQAWCEFYAPFFARHPWLLPVSPLWRLLRRVINHPEWQGEIEELTALKKN